MPGSKKRSSYKRKRKGFNGTQRQEIPRSDDPDQVTSVFEKGDEIEDRISSQRQSQTESQTQNIPAISQNNGFLSRGGNFHMKSTQGCATS